MLHCLPLYSMYHRRKLVYHYVHCLSPIQINCNSLNCSIITMVSYIPNCVISKVVLIIIVGINIKSVK